MLKVAHFTNYRLLRDVSLELGRLNVIVGRNGIGKSSVLQGLNQLLMVAAPGGGRPLRVAAKASVEDRFWRAFQSPHDIMSVATKGAAEPVELTVVADSGARAMLQARLGVTPFHRDDWVIRISLRENGETTSPNLDLEFWAELKDDVQMADEALHLGFSRANLGPALLFRPNPDAIRQPSISEDLTPTLAADGHGVPSVIDHLIRLRDPALDAIERDLSRIVPGFKKLRAPRVKTKLRERIRVKENGVWSYADELREVSGIGIELEMEGAGWLPSALVSEGTLLALALLTALHYGAQRVLLLDDIDQALHPVAQREIVTTLREILTLREDLQIIATSHSPFVLDALAPEEVFIAGPVGPSESRIRRLDSHPGWAQRKGYMHPGEFWSFVGEGWVAESAE